MRLWKLSITLLLCALPVLAQDDSEAAASMPAAGAEKALQEMLASPAPDAETVGNLVIAIHSGRRQIANVQGVHRILAIGILDSDQQVRLNPLRLASFLRLAAQQAVSINLIGAHEPPQGTDGEGGGL